VPAAPAVAPGVAANDCPSTILGAVGRKLPEFDSQFCKSIATRRSLSSFDYCLMFLDDEQGVPLWIALTGGMLFATLLFIRGLGYRLTRR
jgi:hypothetical protein